MEDKEEMIDLGGGRIISKTDYNKALEEYCKTNKTDGVAPLTYDGKVVGRVYTPDGDIKKMTIEIATDEGREIIEGILHQPIGVSSRKMGTVLEDGTVDDSQPFTEFSILDTSKKPSMEKYGWHMQSGLDDEPSGWMYEGGEKAYYEALKEWEILKTQNKNE